LAEDLLLVRFFKGDRDCIKAKSLLKGIRKLAGITIHLLIPFCSELIAVLIVGEADRYAVFTDLSHVTNSLVRAFQ